MGPVSTPREPAGLPHPVALVNRWLRGSWNGGDGSPSPYTNCKDPVDSQTRTATKVWIA